MKSYNHLFEKIVDIDNIKRAIVKAAKGKRRKASVQKALANLDKTALHIQKLLVSGEWRPREIHRAKEINDGIELKKRIIVCPDFVNEQCVHHAIMNVVYPIYLKRFSPHSYGSIPGRGQLSLAKYISKHVYRNPKKTKYYSKLDIRKFFENIQPEIVMKILKRKIRDKRVLTLFERILQANKILLNGKVKSMGVVIGFYTSPFFANLVLDELDHLCKEKLKVAYYIRYMDDILMLHSNKRGLNRILKSFEVELSKLRLSLKFKPQIHKIRTFTFVGYKIKKDRFVLKARIFLKARRCLARVSKNGFISLFGARRVLSYSGYLQHSKMKFSYKAICSSKISIGECREIIRRKSKCSTQDKISASWT